MKTTEINTIQASVNALILSACADADPRTWNMIAKDEAENGLPAGWEFLLQERFGKPPQILVTQVR